MLYSYKVEQIKQTQQYLNDNANTRINMTIINHTRLLSTLLQPTLNCANETLVKFKSFENSLTGKH